MERLAVAAYKKTNVRYILYNGRSELASFVFEGFAQEGTVLVDYPEKPAGVAAKVGRALESFVPGAQLGLYPDPATRRKLRAIRAGDEVIFFAIENARNVGNLKKYIATPDVHVFLWNPVARLKTDAEHSMRQLDLVKHNARRVYTFDPEDARRHGLTLAPQPYRHVVAEPALEIAHDFYFSGVDKGRLPILLQLQSAIEQLGMRHHFHIVGDKGARYAPEHKRQLQERWISYTENVARSWRANCLVEIVQQDQSGPTLRSVEAVFLQKKIITNRPSARDDRFFDPDRVLVFDRVDAEEIRAFMGRPFQPVRPELLQPHEIHAWVRQLRSL